MTDNVREALAELLGAAKECSRMGAQTGKQWSKLTMACLHAETALLAAPVEQPDRHLSNHVDGLLIDVATFAGMPTTTAPADPFLAGISYPPAQPLTWSDAPEATTWGADMLVADVAIDADHTLTLYCERGQEGRVQEMLGAPVAQPLTDEQADALWEEAGREWDKVRTGSATDSKRFFVRAIERAVRGQP